MLLKLFTPYRKNAQPAKCGSHELHCNLNFIDRGGLYVHSSALELLTVSKVCLCLQDLFVSYLNVDIKLGTPPPFTLSIVIHTVQACQSNLIQSDPFQVKSLYFLTRKPRLKSFGKRRPWFRIHRFLQNMADCYSHALSSHWQVGSALKTWFVDWDRFEETRPLFSELAFALQR